jgi:hypothetical protein
MLPQNLKWKLFSKGHPMSERSLKDLFDKSLSDNKVLPGVKYANTNSLKMTLVTVKKRQMLFSSEEDAMTVVFAMIEGRFSIP